MSPEEEQAAAAGGEDSVSNTGAKSDNAASGDVESDRDVVETGAKEVGGAQSVPEETFDTENESSQAVSVSEQGGMGETVDSEMGSKKGEEDEKTEENAAADSASTLKESSSVEGDDQKKRFVAFCILENQNGYLLHWPLCASKIWMLFEGKNAVCICFLLFFHVSFLTLTYPS